jgi:hypothetical protein
MKTPERCVCGDTECPSCGTAQGYTFDQNDVDKLSREIALERLYSETDYNDDEDVDEFYEAMTILSTDIQDPLRRALQALHERKKWNNDGWMYAAIGHLEEVKKIFDDLQIKDVKRFNYQAINELLEKE